MLNAGCSIKNPRCANPASAIYDPGSAQPAKLSDAPLLRHKKDLVGVRILHFSSRRESFHIDIFAGGIRALHQVRFAGDRNSIRIVSLCNLRRRSRGRRFARHCFSRWRTGGLNWSVRIKRLLLRRIFRGLGGIPRRSLTGGWRWRLFRAGDEQKARKERKREWKFHKWKDCWNRIRSTIPCQSLNHFFLQAVRQRPGKIQWRGASHPNWKKRCPIIPMQKFWSWTMTR
jgi:hypothetical protein